MMPAKARVFWSTLLLALTLPVVAYGAGSDLYVNRDAGFQITKPANWHFLPTEVVAKNLALPRLREKDLEQAIRSRPTVPFLVITKYQEPHAGLNPSVQVSFRTQGDLTGKGARALLDRMVTRLKENFSDFQELAPVGETTIDSRPAAQTLAKYTVRDSSGAEFKTVAYMWVIPRGEYMLTINAYAPEDGPDASTDEFKKILGSVKLTEE